MVAVEASTSLVNTAVSEIEAAPAAAMRRGSSPGRVVGAPVAEVGAAEVAGASVRDGVRKTMPQ
ncbi:hypothetical protein GCM10023353_33630 [Tomitella cavernea]|uniref:Uncharacterized protein n=1 Tax=Tomitella cavernea TaxID=1387982 RepID=A0ABP9D3I1_9ACTN